MTTLLNNINIAIVGGGRFCKALLEAILDGFDQDQSPVILGVADPNAYAVGRLYAKKKGIFTTGDYKELYALKGLHLLIELTKDISVSEEIKRSKPGSVQFIDFFEARSLLDRLHIKNKKQHIFEKLHEDSENHEKVEALFEEFYTFIVDTSRRKDTYTLIDRQEILAGEKALSQIVQGSTIPTFVIDKRHTVTHWNRACEKLTGYSAEEIVGTTEQWKPFRSKKRPIMADLILDGVSEEEVWRYYGTQWKRSDLIQGAFEAEEYFEHLGEDGKWLFFTAAPIKNAAGKTIGAIETLWDKTEEKRAQEERECNNLELEEKARELAASREIMAQIIQGSTIPTFVIDKNHTIIYWNKALESLTGCRGKEMVGTNRQWMPFWESERPSMADVILDQIDEREIKNLYGTKWRKSVLIEDAYEAEIFFSNLGQSGRWCFFTAAPLRSPEGEMIGAIETLWDKTEEKKAQVALAQHNRDLARQAKALVASEKTMAQIIQGSTIPTFVIDREHKITHWNRACEKLTGFSADEMVGTRKQWKPFRLKKRPIMADMVLDGVSEEEVWRYYSTTWKKSELIRDAYEAEEYFEHLGDGGKWLFFTAAPLTDSDGTVVGAIETLWDKTEEKKAEQEQTRHTRELATLVSIYATLSAPLDLQGRINEALKEITNIFSFDSICVFVLESAGRYQLKFKYGTMQEVCENSNFADIESFVFQVGQTGKYEFFESIEKEEGQEIQWLRKAGLNSLAYIPLLGKEKKAIGVIRAGSKKSHRFDNEEKNVLTLFGNRIGVTIENSILQEEINRRANFQAKLINSSKSGVVATDAQWNVVLYNPEARRLFEYTRDEVVGSMDARSLFPEVAIASIEEKAANEAMRDFTSWEETVIQSKSGEQIPVNFSGVPLFENDKMMGSVAFFQDIREIKNLQKELVNSERLAAVGQTVAGMAHGIKNILNGFKGGQYLVDIGIDKNNVDKLKNGWDMIKRNIEQTSELVMDLLSYSKEREPDYKACNPNDIAGDVCELVQGNAQDYEIEIVRDFSDRVGEVILDPTTVHRALMNLVGNAIDACIFDDNIGKEHQVYVRTRREGRFITFEVEDNGSGMDDAVKKRLFSSFFSTKGAKGTGLGLLVTNKLVEENNGEMEVRSSVGEGTTFTIRLPFIVEAAQDAQAPPG
ncbi:MAG: PAS domain S-box protein [Deltaproteobacteria bacterium]|nr:PAS domain S-box protein [Deltaproteobacteria bacterium]